MLRDSVRSCLNASFLSKSPSTPYVRQSGDTHRGSLYGGAILESLHAVGVPWRLRVRGFSMSPAIKDRDVVIVSPLPEGHPVKGDVVAFLSHSDQRLRIHRAVERHPGGWVMKGDNCLTDDGVVPSDCLLGLVTYIARPGRLARLLHRVRDRVHRKVS